MFFAPRGFSEKLKLSNFEFLILGVLPGISWMDDRETVTEARPHKGWQTMQIIHFFSKSEKKFAKGAWPNPPPPPKYATGFVAQWAAK